MPYLTREAVFVVLRFVAAQKNNQIVFDYGEPLHTRPILARLRALAFAARVAALGEPFLTFFIPATLHAELRALGFDEIEDLDVASIAARYFPQRPIRPGSGGGHLIRARAG